MDTFGASAPLKELQHKFGSSRIASLRPQKSCSPSARKQEVSLPKARTHVLLEPGSLTQLLFTEGYRPESEAGRPILASLQYRASRTQDPTPLMHGSILLIIRKKRSFRSAFFLQWAIDGRNGVCSGLPSLTIVPIVNVFASLILGDPVALLNLALQLIAAAADDVEVIVRQLSPLLLHLSFDLLPVSFHAVPVHFWHSFYIVQYADKRKAPFPSSICAGVGESGKQVLG
jgi:hypothetical protein